MGELIGVALGDSRTPGALIHEHGAEIPRAEEEPAVYHDDTICKTDALTVYLGKGRVTAT